MKFYNYKPIRLIELFAGIGSQAKALKNLGINFEHWNVCEFDEHAIRSYNAVHGTNFTTSDITKINTADLNIVDTDRFTYLLTYSFPCQDLSNAGKGAGMGKGSGTRSGLLWEVERLLNECDELPQVLLMENVPQVHGKKNIEHFNKWIEFLESKGYSNHWKDLNSKDYGIPQSRNRCFMVSILGNYSYEFPAPIPLTLRLKDLLDDIVDERYYLSDRQIDKMKNHTFASANYSHRVSNENSIVPTLLARDYKDPKCVQLGQLYGTEKEPNPQAGRIYDAEGISPTVDTCSGGNRMPKVVVREPSELQKEVCNKALENKLMKPFDIIDYTYSNARLDEINNGKIKTKNSTDNQVANTITTNAENMGVCVPYSNDAQPFIQIAGDSVIVREASKNGYAVASEGDSINLEYPNSTTRRGRVGKQVAQTLLTSDQQAVCVPNLRIRKLTPKECWRLMGFNDIDFENAEKVNSNSQLYKQAGNSIVVNVLMAIFKELFITDQNRSDWLDALLRG